MYKCDCGRKFTRKSGLGYHKRYCGKNKISYDGGYQCRIDNDGNLIYIHREILEQKIGRKLLPGEVSHHIDENKLNNHPDNLELSTTSKHAKHHYDKLPKDKKEIFSKLGRKNFGEDNGNSKLTNEQVKNIKDRIITNEKCSIIAEDNNVCIETIYNIRRGAYWKDISTKELYGKL